MMKGYLIYLVEALFWIFKKRKNFILENIYF